MSRRLANSLTATGVALVGGYVEGSEDLDRDTSMRGVDDVRAAFDALNSR